MDFGRDEENSELNVEAKRKNFLPKEIMVRSLNLIFDMAKENDITIMYLNFSMNQSSYQALTNEYKKGGFEDGK